MRRLLITLTAVALSSSAVPAATEVVSQAEERPILTAIQEGATEGTYELVCRGGCEHRLVQTADGMLVVLELPNVANRLAAINLPAPRGLVREIAIGGALNEPTEVRFALLQPARAMARPTDQGFDLRIEPGAVSGAAAVPIEHPIGPEDLLEVSVFEIPELNRKVRVSEGGTISLPLVGEMPVRGLTAVQLEQRLKEELGKKYLRDPQVSVFVQEYGSKTVSVIGAVGTPGVYEMLGRRTLLQILSQAGGLKDTAGAEIIVVSEANGGEQKRIAIKVADLMANRDPGLNVPIHPGDIITVPRDRLVYVYVDGAVKTPGRIEQLSSRPMTLLQVIAKAGGTTERANQKAIQLLRNGPDGTQILRQLNLKLVRQGKEADPELENGDIVVVPETFF